MVRDSILIKIKRIVVPFGAVSTASLFAGFNTAHAETMGDIIFQKKGILLHGSEGKGIIGGTKEVWHNIEWITEKIIFGLNWLLELPLKIPEYSADLLTLIYKLLSYIALQTPTFIFDNPVIKNTSLTFSILSISIVTILTIYEAFMQMFRKEHTDLKTIVKRWAVVASVSGFIPFAFEKGFEFLNKLSLAISKIGNFNGGSSSGFINSADLGIFDTLIVIMFDITAISLLIPFALQAGKRWFSLGVLSAISPLALTARIFDRHRKYFDRWLDEVKELGIVQLVQAVFLLIMGVFIFSTQSITGGLFVIISKMLLVIGGLHHMINPPRMITALAGRGEDIFDVYDDYKKNFNTIKDTVTLKKFRPVNFIREKMSDNKATKGKVKELQQKHGRRYVKDLL
jgi:hypothetical protein